MISTAKKIYAVTLLIAILLLFLGDTSYALRCGNRLVDEGDRKIEVLLKCGEPLLIEKWKEEAAVYEDEIYIYDSKLLNRRKLIRRRIGVYNEEWTYNFGSNRFMRFLQFRDHKLVNIIDGPKGFAGDLPLFRERSGCPNALSVGDRKIEVMMKCGDPVLKEKIEDELSNVISEEWTYNFGPRESLYFIKFRHGAISRIETGDRGYWKGQYRN